MIGLMMRRSIQPALSPLRSSLSLACVALLGLALAGCDARRDARLQGRASDEWTRSYALQSGGEVQIVGAIGSIEVEGGSGPTVEVRAERVVRAGTDASAQSMVSHVRIREDVAEDKIVLQSEGLGGIVIGAEIEVNFHVTVPASTRLRLRAAAGNITVANVDGAVVASTTNGRITGKALGGGVDARSTNGNLTIDLASLSKDPVDLRAVNGQIALTVPAAANANIEANCTNGSIDIADLPVQLTGEQTRRRARGRLNDGGSPIELTTTNGNIQVRPRP